LPPVCLIIPPSIFLLDERVFMTLGILRIAAVLEQAGCCVEVLDLSGVQNYEEVARLHATSSQARVFALTATTPQLPAATRIAQAIRHTISSAKLILGGPHIRSSTRPAGRSAGAACTLAPQRPSSNAPRRSTS